MYNIIIVDVKTAAKVVLWTPENRVLTLTTPSNVLNIPGGGVENGETVRGALWREIGEEIPGFFVYDVTQEPIGCVSGDISRGRTAVWHVFQGRVQVPSGLRAGISGQIPIENNCFNLRPIETIPTLERTGSCMATRAIFLSYVTRQR